MKKFEYDMVPVPVGPDYVTYLNQRGQEGWQVVSIQNPGGTATNYVTFMREIDQEAWRTAGRHIFEQFPKHNHSIDQTCWMDCPLRGTVQEIR